MIMRTAVNCNQSTGFPELLSNILKLARNYEAAVTTSDGASVDITSAAKPGSLPAELDFDFTKGGRRK